MANDHAVGAGILVGSILGIIVYGALLWFWAVLILEVTAFLGVVVLLGILGWIGWTMATTPPPEPMPEMGQSNPQVDTGTNAGAESNSEQKT